MFFHFGVNTFTDREWGDGKEDPKIFNPTALDCRQWARTAKAAGFKLLILTAKHHDGFCLWPSKFTEHSVKNSTWQNGRGDVVREFTDACRAESLKIGLYLSPWDRNNAAYGSDAYNDYFVNQLTELLANYGKIDEMWFDGANGEGPNGKRQEYDWTRYYATIRNLAPQALIAISGPDIRWVGNESGVARSGESSITPDGTHPDGTPKFKWYPAECDVSIRPGWFYHSSEDGKLKSLAKLTEIYFASVGRNSVLLMNVPPDQRGLMADVDVNRLREFGNAINGLRDGGIPAVPVAAKTGGDANTVTLMLDFGTAREFNVLNVQEDIALGERVTKYRIEAEINDAWSVLARGSVIGHRNLHAIERTKARRLRLVIEGAKAVPCIEQFSAHLAPVVPPPVKSALTSNKPATASDTHGNNTTYGADKAVDGDDNTRWATNDATSECTLQVDMEQPQTFSRATIKEMEPRISRFAIEYKSAEGDAWQTAYTGGTAGPDFSVTFPPVSARFVRLHILAATLAPTLWEFGVWTR